MLKVIMLRKKQDQLEKREAELRSKLAGFKQREDELAQAIADATEEDTSDIEAAVAELETNQADTKAELKKIRDDLDKVIGEIITDDMSVPEQAYAIFDYCYSNIIYTGTSDKTDWKSEAYRGLTEGVGDCFTFYSASYALLQKIDCRAAWALWRRFAGGDGQKPNRIRCSDRR